MKILFDTNVILDVLFNRAKFIEPASFLISAVEKKLFEGFLCATTITTLDYLIAKQTNAKQAKIEIKKLLSIFSIADVNTAVIKSALNSNFKDFEDAVQYYSGKNALVEALVTRNIKDYKVASYPIYSPEELSIIIQSTT